jgi:hypothetical protein
MMNATRKFPRAALWLSVAAGLGGGGTLAMGGFASTAWAQTPAAPPAASEAGRPLEPPAAPLLDAQILDLDDKPVSLRAMHGRVVIVLHQDRYSSEQNQGFKDRLGELVLRHPQQLQLVALAEAGGYNFWPARRYVKDALRPLRELGGALVACDWKGAVQKNYRIPARQSAVFVVGKDGTLQALKKGVLGEAEAAALLSQIEKLALG